MPARAWDPSGTFDWGGAAGTLWMIDPQRRGKMVFMSQQMQPETYPIRGDMREAIAADLRWMGMMLRARSGILFLMEVRTWS